MKATKKIISLVLVLVLCLFLAVPSLALERDRVKIGVDSEEEILEFLNSPQYDPQNHYTFSYADPNSINIVCPHCGYNTYRGKLDTVEYSIFPHMCPYYITTLNDDLVTVYKIYSYSYCITCGYESAHVYIKSNLYIECITGAIFWAYDGQTMAGGYDIHECKSTWGY